MKVAAVQFKPQKGQIPEALERLCTLIEAAGEQGARLVVCPEMAHTGYLFRDAAHVRPFAEPARGGAYPRLAALARRHGLHLVAGYVEAEGEALYNAARVIAPDGSLLDSYRKRLLYDSDLTWARPGITQPDDSDGSDFPPYPLYETPFGRMAVGICMDLNDDRFTDFLRDAQPELIAFPTNWLDQGHDIRPYWRYRLVGVRSVLIAANTYGEERCEPHPPTRFLGRSAILTLHGLLRARTLAIAPAEGDAILLAELPTAASDPGGSA